MGNCLNYEISDDESSVYSSFEEDEEKSYNSKHSSISLNQDEVAKSTKSSSNQSKSIQNSENSNRYNSAPLVPLPRKIRQRRHQYFDVCNIDILI